MMKVKIMLIVAVAGWGYVGAFHNIADWSGTLGAVKAATSMSTFEGGADSWQATSSSVVVWLGALFILLSKLATAALCSWGAIKMWQSQSTDFAQYQAAKKVALSGCGVALFMLFFGFIVVAESWFELWRSELMRGPVLGSAFRYAALIALIAVFIAGNDEQSS
jgi:predicted small integral membrane protein